MVVKIVNDVLIETLGSDAEPIDLNAAPPVAIMMVGLQGAGKTTTTAKIAKRLSERFKKRVLMASLDVKRPAAQEQLAVLGRQVNVDTLPIIAGQTPVQIARRAEEAARLQGYDVVMFDTAGRTHIDEPLMEEMAEIKAAAKPHEILLVADALTGQDAVNLAKNFDDHVGITGIVLTRVDGDGRGGAALSMRAVTGKPIKLIGIGEKMDALDDFHPQRIANRILGMGDIVALVEKAAENIDAEKAAAPPKGCARASSTSGHVRPTRHGRKDGRARRHHGHAARVGKLKDAMANAKVDDNMLKRQRAIILSMTPEERRNPDILKASRKKRIAAGAGTTVDRQPAAQAAPRHRRHDEGDGRRTKRGPMAQMAQMFGMGKGMDMPSPEQMAELQKKREHGMVGGLPKAPPAP